MSIGRINQPGAPTPEQAHLEGLAPDPDLRPGEWIHDGRVYRIERLPGGYELLVQVRMLPWKRAQLLDPLFNVWAARFTLPRWSGHR